ncbi:MAG: hypothetical protein HLUCCA01_06880 [Bacteroidetes bacterium HLUCCA01]|nr:MAG: hypothetical protein HLUCCA01_06880 [Bacteroidetes bacterium HLUCCA01]
MKKLLFTLLFALPVLAFAQVNENVNASASINASLELTKVSDLVFGNITDTADPAVINTDGTTANSNVGTGATAAQVTVNTGTPVAYTITAGSGATLAGNVLTLDNLDSSAPSAVEDLEITLNYHTGETTRVSYTPGAASSTGGSSAEENTLNIGGTISATELGDKTGNSYAGVIVVTVDFL